MATQKAPLPRVREVDGSAFSFNVLKINKFRQFDIFQRQTVNFYFII